MRALHQMHPPPDDLCDLVHYQLHVRAAAAGDAAGGEHPGCDGILAPSVCGRHLEHAAPWEGMAPSPKPLPSPWPLRLEMEKSLHPKRPSMLWNPKLVTAMAKASWDHLAHVPGCSDGFQVDPKSISNSYQNLKKHASKPPQTYIKIIPD